MRILFFATLLFFLLATPARAQVVISEVYPAPTSEEKEWVELYNTGEETVDISGWKLFEHFSNKNELVLFDNTNFENTNIEAKSFFVIELPTNKLNNSEEKISLENSNSEEISSLHFNNSESQKSFSYSFIDKENISDLLELSDPTKGVINQIIPENTPTPTPTPIATQTPSPTPNSEPKSSPNTFVETRSESEKNIVEKPKLINQKLEKYKIIKRNLSFPKLKRIEKDGLVKRLPQFSYIVQKNVSKQGVINAIMGGSLIIFIGFLL